jgi:hypothetical protein
VVIAAIDLGFIAPVVLAIGGAGRDEERGCVEQGWLRRGSARLVEDRRCKAGGGEWQRGLAPSCQCQAWG